MGGVDRLDAKRIRKTLRNTDEPLLRLFFFVTTVIPRFRRRTYSSIFRADRSDPPRNEYIVNKASIITALKRQVN